MTNKTALIYEAKDLAENNMECFIEAARQHSIEGNKTEDRRCIKIANQFGKIVELLYKVLKE